MTDPSCRLQGQMGAVYLFDEALSQDQMCGIYHLGPAYMYAFESGKVDYRTFDRSECVCGGLWLEACGVCSCSHASWFACACVCLCVCASVSTGRWGWTSKRSRRHRPCSLRRLRLRTPRRTHLRCMTVAGSWRKPVPSLVSPHPAHRCTRVAAPVALIATGADCAAAAAAVPLVVVPTLSPPAVQ